jgi:hypothetical protein
MQMETALGPDEALLDAIRQADEAPYLGPTRGPLTQAELVHERITLLAQRMVALDRHDFLATVPANAPYLRSIELAHQRAWNALYMLAAMRLAYLKERT